MINDCYHVVPAGVLYQRLSPGAASAELIIYNPLKLVVVSWLPGFTG